MQQMTIDGQPEPQQVPHALDLASLLESGWHGSADATAAAHILRRQHEEIESLRETLKRQDKAHHEQCKPWTDAAKALQGGWHHQLQRPCR